MTSATSSSPASPAPAAACLVLTLAATAALPDWSGSGVARPLWALLLPAALGLAGAGLALLARRPGWAAACAAVGFGAVPALIVVTTIVSGP